jgi:hypothetical protein
VLAKLRSRLTYANVMATIAVFVALGGSSYAAVTLTRSSVKGKHIAKNAVTSPKVKNGSLRRTDFRAGVLSPGPRGAEGPRGEQGPKGDQGAAGSAVAYGYVRADGTFDPARSKNLLASALTSGNIYCLRFATAPTNLVASVDATAGGFASVTENAASLATNCGVVLPTANVLALTASIGGGTPKPFYVLVN